MWKRFVIYLIYVEKNQIELIKSLLYNKNTQVEGVYEEG